MNLMVALALAGSLPAADPPTFHVVHLVDPRPIEMPMGRMRIKRLQLFMVEPRPLQHPGRIDMRLRRD